jgi:hypothetical protein
VSSPDDGDSAYTKVPTISKKRVNMRQPAAWSFSMGLAIALGPAALGQYTITTIAGGGSLDGALATTISIQGQNVAVDSTGNVLCQSGV